MQVNYFLAIKNTQEILPMTVLLEFLELKNFQNAFYEFCVLLFFLLVPDQMPHFRGAWGIFENQKSKSKSQNLQWVKELFARCCFNGT
jgi:hypothetical protein